MSDLLILQVRATGFIQYSDLRLKTNVQDLVDALRMVQDLQAKTYHWKSTPTAGPEEENGGKRVIGFIAQEVQRVVSFSSPFLSTVNTNAILSPPKKKKKKNQVPEVVHEDPETGLLSVSYTELVPVLLEALKQHLAGYAKVHTSV